MYYAPRNSGISGIISMNDWRKSLYTEQTGSTRACMIP